MTDRLIPAEPDGLPGALGPADDPTGIPSLAPHAPGQPAGHAGAKPKVSPQVVIAALVLVVAAGAIYAMRTVGLNAGFGDDQVKIDYASNASPDTARRFGRVMEELDASLRAVQVADTAGLPPAPFTRPEAAAAETPVVFEAPETMDDLERLALLAEQRRLEEQQARSAHLESELARLYVQSIIVGVVPAARINGMPVTVGRTIGPFTVSEITREAVYVTADGLTWELVLGSPARLVE